MGNSGVPLHQETAENLPYAFTEAKQMLHFHLEQICD